MSLLHSETTFLRFRRFGLYMALFVGRVVLNFFCIFPDSMFFDYFLTLSYD